MSRIYFHSPIARVEVRGSERFYMGHITSELFNAMLELPSSVDEADLFLKLLPSNCYLHHPVYQSPSNWAKFISGVRSWISTVGGDGSYFKIGDRLVDVFETRLNTALLVGNDPIKLMARLHGQSEIHCYVESQNRLWLAEIIKEGLATGVYRKEQGWEAAIYLLEDGHDSPVVTSYSVCHPFPNPIIANFTPIEEDWDTWWNLPEAHQWQLGMVGVRGNKRSLEMTPDNWRSFYFGDGWNAFKLNRLLALPYPEWGKSAEQILRG